MSERNNVAIFDLGKTHAKMVLFDALSFKELAVFEQRNLIRPAPPYPHYDIGTLKAFVLSSLHSMAARHPVDSVFVSAHGAAFACMIGNDLALPVLDYEFDGPDELAVEYDGIRPPFETTGSPRMGAGLNLGAQIFWLNRTYPSAFSKIDQILLWPQFWAHWLCGVAASEVAYASSHSDIWDLKNNRFIPPQNFGVRPGVRFPPLRRSDEVLGNLRPELAAETGLPSDTRVYCGGHDSSLSLVMTAKSRELPCTVLSTGTWITVFALGTNSPPIKTEPGLMISADCYGNTVPNFRFPGGQIFADLTASGGNTPSQADTTTDLRLAGFDRAETANVIDAASGAPVDVSGLPKVQLKELVSRLLAEQTFCGMQATGASGTIICSGPFAGNKSFLNLLSERSNSPIVIEENRMGLCKGIAALITGV